LQARGKSIPSGDKKEIEKKEGFAWLVLSWKCKREKV
jgi:hypothetical protein